MKRLNMGRRKVLAAMLAVPATGLLAGCGFHMRGNSDFAFKRLYLGMAPNSPMAADLTRAIRGGSDTVVVSDPKQADALLDVLEDNRSKTVLSITTTGTCSVCSSGVHGRPSRSGTPSMPSTGP